MSLPNFLFHRHSWSRHLEKLCLSLVVILFGSVSIASDTPPTDRSADATVQDAAQGDEIPGPAAQDPRLVERDRRIEPDRRRRDHERNRPRRMRSEPTDDERRMRRHAQRNRIRSDDKDRDGVRDRGNGRDERPDRMHRPPVRRDLTDRPHAHRDR